MSILDYLGLGSGSLMNTAKQGAQQSSILQLLGLDDAGAPTAASATPSSMVNPALQSGGSLADIGRGLSAFGAGMSKASDFSRTPVSFGQAMAGGNDALQASEDRQLDSRLKEAQIGAYGAKALPDLEKSAQLALVKSNMGMPLSPQEQASLQAFDTMNQSKLSYTQDRFGNFVPQPAARSILPQNMQQTNPSGNPAPDLQGLRAYHQYLLQKAGQQ